MTGWVLAHALSTSDVDCTATVMLKMPENCQAYYRRMLTRPAVRQVLAEEGYASVLR